MLDSSLMGSHVPQPSCTVRRQFDAAHSLLSPLSVLAKVLYCCDKHSGRKQREEERVGFS